MFPQSDGSHGYGYWVCHTLSNLPPEAILEPGSQQLNDIAMRGLLQARDCLQRLVEREPDNVWALNHLALLLEQEGLLGPAQKALEKYILGFYTSLVLIVHSTHFILWQGREVSTRFNISSVGYTVFSSLHQ